VAMYSRPWIPSRVGRTISDMSSHMLAQPGPPNDPWYPHRAPHPSGPRAAGVTPMRDDVPGTIPTRRRFRMRTRNRGGSGTRSGAAWPGCSDPGILRRAHVLSPPARQSRTTSIPSPTSRRVAVGVASELRKCSPAGGRSR
jgi:hypothetical protein